MIFWTETASSVHWQKCDSFGSMMEMRLGKLQQIELGGQLGYGKLI